VTTVKSNSTRQPRPNFSTPYEPAETDTEQKLLAICESLLGIDGLGVNDDFYEAGGHSLMLGILLAQIQEVFSTTISFMTLMAETNIRALAKQIDIQCNTKSDDTLASLLDEFVKS